MKKLQVNNSDASKKFPAQFNIASSKVASQRWLFLVICRWDDTNLVMVSDDWENAAGGLRFKVISLPQMRQNPQSHLFTPKT